MNIQVVLNYIEAINAGDIDRLYGLMAENHIFIDAHDNRIIGKENMKQSWIGYFALFPDYKIEVQEILEKNTLICILGYAGGTYKNLKDIDNSNYWRVPAAWAAVVENKRIKQWQVYADNIFAIEIYNRNEKDSWSFDKD